ncbi:MAG TPA: hypothetical protein DD000_13225, partial [Cyanobacteria bacterium UBA11166]|nr:hypothetical protein [Cyanobacteria bacterium UBA11166]
MKFFSSPINQTICAGFLTLSLISIASPSLAITVEKVPNPRQINGGWVTDMADVLTPETETQLNQIISQLESENGSEIAVVTVEETTPSPTPKHFATTLFNHWHIGKVGQNNGVLFLISEGERRVEIETGTGLQTILPNQKVSEIIQQEVVPHFKTGDYNSGTLAATKALKVALETSNQPVNLNITTPASGETIQTLETSSQLVSTNPNNIEYNPISWYGWLGGVGLGVLGIGLAVRYSKNNQSKSNNISPSKSRSSPNYSRKGNSSK